MQPTYIPISTIFSQDQRYTVPLFQRPYVWSQEVNWEPLWDDVLGVLHRLKRREDNANVASHFLGTVVLEQIPNATGNLPCREIIDGQQRLTTLQILLKAAEHSLSECLESISEDDNSQIELARRQIARLTANEAAADEIYKVWPTNEDRAAFMSVMNSKSGEGVGAALTRMAEAYRYFRNVIADYLNEGDLVEQANLISDALRNYLKMIVLDLDTSDEPQAIFETLNAHGTPLLPADLIKNWLLWEAGKQKLEAKPLYENHWRSFDKDDEYWRDIVGTGHAARARVDTFLQNWLAKETAEAVPAKHLYDRFLRYTENKKHGTGSAIDVDALMAGIKADAVRFERIDRPSGKSRFDIFLERLQRLGIVVFHPLLLEVMQACENSPEKLDKFCVVMESYLVRRMVCGNQTRGYGTLAIRLLKAVRSEHGETPHTIIRQELEALDGSDIWPSDEEFRFAWINRKFYGQLRRDRVLMILQVLEQWYQTSNAKTEPLMAFDWSQLQIEHIMPQSWEDHWPLPDELPAEKRKENIQKIGNLTLVSKKLNPSLSNAPWIAMQNGKGKRDGLHAHTILYLNRMLVDKYPEIWSDDTIDERAAFLYEVAESIWTR